MAIQSQLFSQNFEFGLEGKGVLRQENYVEHGFGFDSGMNFNLQHRQQQQFTEFQPQQQQQFQFLPQKYESLCFEKNGFTQKYNNQSLNLSGTISAQMEKQRQEIDQFLSVQNERLRLALLEHKKQQVSMIIKRCESKALVLLRQKDEEIARALNKRLEVENMIRAMEIESQNWQRMAKENEAMVMSLNNTIEQLKENAVCLSLNNNGGADQDAESCCDDNRGVEIPENEQQRRICRSCYSCDSCVIFLPCRHLASCKACDAFLDTCPVCGMAKKSRIEALI
ncbi:putative BOI-related E3 ubiquitin-protein ligase 2 [Apium graveolens]|uniref:putative BOI-related E3 ubiquitin-protein ligase 2 n=1 Tax=Apium graveolens TaxID=4045 RepID=UPI003D793DFB